MTQPLSNDVLSAALAGLEAQKQKIEDQISQVRSMLGIASDGARRRGRPPKSAASAPVTASAPTARKRRAFSAETRARMAESQRKRWAAAKDTAAPAKAPAKKRRLSAAGRKRIIEAAKKRWAEHRANKEKE